MDDEIEEKSPSSTDAKTVAGKNPPWKAELNDRVIKGLDLNLPPVAYDKSGKLLFAQAPVAGKSSYILWDTSRTAPPGFGVKVASKKTYILRRKVMGKSLMSKVGDFADFNNISQARERAGELARAMLALGRNPNAVKRELSAAEVTLGQAMAAFRKHMLERTQKPFKPESLRVYDRVVKRHEKAGWLDLKVREIAPEKIIKKFLETNKVTPEATDQAFRWPTRAINWYIENEKMLAEIEMREPHLKSNPFYTLALNGFFRTQDQKDAERELKGVRNPLRPSQDLGRFLEAAWSKKDMNDNLTGIHYIMLMLLWGCRKSEHAGLVWGELLKEIGEPGEGRRATSHVCLTEDPDWGPYVFFYGTKNGRNHRMPITPMTLELLKRRQAAAADEAVRRGFGSKSRKFVFPARSRFSKTGHYMDSTDLLDDLREEINVERLNRHDLRRSFGAVMTELEVPETIKSRFLNHAKSKVTEIYTQAEWLLLRDWMRKIEQSILVKAPNVYNSLKPSDWPPIPAPPVHVCRPPKPRTGRPPKEARAMIEKSELSEGKS